LLKYYISFKIKIYEKKLFGGVEIFIENNSMNNKMRYDKINLLLFAMVFIGLVVIFSYGVGNVSAAGNTVYVNALGGNDSWNGLSASHSGTLSGPKLSIKNATGTVDADGTVNIADGQYTGENNTNITINTDMNITGQSETGTIINGTGTNWIFIIPLGINVNINTLTITNGTNFSGGAIFNYGTLSVTGSKFIGNTANVGGAGGAVYNNAGVLTVTGSNFSGNLANVGGAIYNSGGTLTITCSNFSGNAANRYCSGGAIYNDLNGNLTVDNSNFFGNTAPNGEGGAIDNNYQGTLNVTNSNFTSNTAFYGYGGAVSNHGSLNVTRSTFTGNTASNGYGGAVSNYSTLNLTDSTFTDNNASLGGAIYNEYGTVDVHFNRFYGNTATSGSGIFKGAGDASFNWWGSNTDPSSYVSGSVTVTPWLVLNVTAKPPIIKKNGKSNITADLLHDSNGGYHDPASGHVSDGIPVIFKTTLGTINSPLSTVNGVATSTLGSGFVSGVANISATVDNQTVHTLVTIDTITPTVKAIDPANNAVNVPANKLIKVTFSEPIKAGTMWIELKNSMGKLIIITKTISTNVLTINHSIPLTTGKYTLTLHTGSITDLAGNPLALKVSSFNVDITPPKVSSTTPTNLKTGVSRTSSIIIKFTENFKASTYYSNIKVKNLTTGKYVTITKTISGTTLNIKTSKRSANTWYLVTIPKAAVKDYASNNLAANYIFKFKTGT